MIHISNLVKKYGSMTAVNGLSLEVSDGQVFALLGLNGAGKSTTIKILCSLTKKTSGEVYIDGKNLDTQAEEIKQIVNLSPQETAVANHLTVRENLRLIADLYGVENAAQAVAEMLKKFTLSAKADVFAKTLSGGQKRRLSLAMALISSPKLLILDEPTLGLDIKARRELWQMIQECRTRATILLTTHYLEEAESLADVIGVMNHGKLVACGTAEEIKKLAGTESFEDAFLALAGGEENE